MLINCSRTNVHSAITIGRNDTDYFFRILDNSLTTASVVRRAISALLVLARMRKRRGTESIFPTHRSQFRVCLTVTASMVSPLSILYKRPVTVILGLHASGKTNTPASNTKASPKLYSGTVTSKARSVATFGSLESLCGKSSNCLSVSSTTLPR